MGQSVEIKIYFVYFCQKNCFLKTAETCFLQAYYFYLLTLSSYWQLFFALSPDATCKDFTRIQI